MVCEDRLEALPGLMVDTVEALSGWNNNEAFFSSRGEESWGTDLSFERCIGMARSSSSSDPRYLHVVVVCPGMSVQTNIRQVRCVQCVQTLVVYSIRTTQKHYQVDVLTVRNAVQGSTAYLRGTVLSVTLLLVILGIMCFDRFVRKLDSALETGTLAPRSRVARLLRLRRQYKESKKGKRRRSTFSVVSMTKDTTTTTTTSVAQNQDDGMTTSSSDYRNHLENLQVSTNDDNEVSTKENNDDEDLSPRSRWKKRREMMSDDVVQPPIMKEQQEEEEATTSRNGGLERDWLDDDDDDVMLKVIPQLIRMIAHLRRELLLDTQNRCECLV